MALRDIDGTWWVRLMVELNDLEGLCQPRWFYDSVVLLILTSSCFCYHQILFSYVYISEPEALVKALNSHRMISAEHQ